ncbi:hypothetical protein HN51_035613 [Arachis hypogaea]|uniref:Seed maturation protein n=1 Tax=Arachis hypogaea TaxID=3818 RepID=A0A445A3K7_ARAHY|nr:uncharacterized protein LOC107634308 [Arachis ipaensis]XP_025643889.1 uncharacterized protein LOC112737942 [Arachis hypogaea]RYR21030.1 hypothetical protein Ahy_B03g066268 [Arachis hypogaea]
MAQSKDDITYGTAQARVSDDEALRVAYKHGTPLEAGKIAESEPVDLFQSAHNISKSSATQDSSSQEKRDSNNKEASSTEFVTGAPDLPKKVPPTMAHK